MCLCKSTHWPWNMWQIYWKCNFRARFTDRYQHFPWNCLQLNTAGHCQWYVNIAAGNGLLPSGQQAITRANVDSDLCHQITSLGHNEIRIFPRRTYAISKTSQIAKYVGPTWSPTGSCRPQMGPMLALWTLPSGINCYCWQQNIILKYILR